jgi:hypothetical protein
VNAAGSRAMDLFRTRVESSRDLGGTSSRGHDSSLLLVRELPDLPGREVARIENDDFLEASKVLCRHRCKQTARSRDKRSKRAVLGRILKLGEFSWLCHYKMSPSQLPSVRRPLPKSQCVSEEEVDIGEKRVAPELSTFSHLFSAYSAALRISFGRSE